MGELLHNDLSARLSPKIGGNDGLLEGNYISFAIACRWIEAITYVHHPSVPQENLGIHDIPNCLFRNNDPHCGVIEFKKLPNECRHGFKRLSEYEPLALEPAVPIRLQDCHSFSTKLPVSFVFVAQSPNYTPSSSDHLLDVFRQFIDEDALK